MSEFKSGFFVGGDACNGRILVVDDEPDIRKVVKMALQNAGYDVLHPILAEIFCRVTRGKH